RLGLLELTQPDFARVAGAGAHAPAPARRRPPLPLVVGGLVASVVVLVPVTYIAVRATDRGWDEFFATLWRARTLHLAGRSLGLAAIVTGACAVIGVGLAWLVTCTDLAGRSFWRVVLAMPLALPSYVAAWA